MIKLDRIQISYDLKFDTPFHCGTGIREGLIDRTIQDLPSKGFFVNGVNSSLVSMKKRRM